MIVDNALYRNGVRVPLDFDIADLASVRSRCSGPDSFVWVGLLDPTEEELVEVAEEFGLHNLAVEDAVKAHQRPKLEKYDDSLFMVLKTLWYVDEEDAVETGEINLFVGSDFIVSVRHGEGSELHSSRSYLEGKAELLVHGPTAVVYAVCDRVVDGYERVAASLEEDVDEVEASVFAPERTDDSPRIYVLKRELAEVRRAVLPLRDPVRRASTASVPGMSGEAAPYFRDVGDHLARVAETVDNLDSLLSSAFEAQQARISVQQNEDMRKISAGVGLVAAPTLVGAIYGMNFDHMPELHWAFGYPFALCLMALSSLVAFIFFKKSGWL
ncbi:MULTISPECIES: magnesium/cobalt transporter CorA [unclassified Nocardioides]|uniref:magnesium/cobalt transporter CorA n=1 Tax=unclassified Nocardioides TaxID=2615069 RepID=UPI000703662F|nr:MULTISPECIES: magnesium/cobalt transporter CorA [unclassified Nocardioides]KQZ70389.1 magnesium transporter CorA [Nocardioides sp. Root151]KRF18249.1 magnesium transporter CorA [Nocardioides sp. Soil796]